MNYPPDNETIMAASERLMELIEKRDAEEALRQREDRLWETGEFKVIQPGEPDDA